MKKNLMRLLSFALLLGSVSAFANPADSSYACDKDGYLYSLPGTLDCSIENVQAVENNVVWWCTVCEVDCLGSDNNIYTDYFLSECEKQ